MRFRSQPFERGKSYRPRILRDRADAQVQAAATAVVVLERRLEKMILRAAADGVVSVIAAEVGENVRAGQPILMVQAVIFDTSAFDRSC